MRILLVSNIFPPGFIGGYELAARDVARMLARRGHDVVVLSSATVAGDEDADEPYAVVRTLRVGFTELDPEAAAARHHEGPLINLANLDALRAELVHRSPDAVICFNLAGLGVLCLLRLLEAMATPTVLFFMDNWFAGIASRRDEYRSFMRCLAMASPYAGARVLACSTSLVREIAEEMEHPVPFPILLPAWVDRRLSPTPRLRAGETVRFVFSSYLGAHKGIGIVLDAVAILLGQCVRGFTVDLFGGGDVVTTIQRTYAMNIEDVVRYRGKPDKVEMVGAFAGYDALLFPTWSREPSGFVATEAAAAGCIPIITADAGSSEYLLDGRDCIKIRRTPEALAEAMLSVIDETAEARLAMREAVRRACSRLFDAEHWYDKIEATIGEVVAAHRGVATTPDQAFAAIVALTLLWKAGRG